MKIEIQKPPMEVGVMTLYDSVYTGKNAKGLCDRLQQHLGSEYELNISLWNLAALKISTLSQAIAKAAMQPGLLLIAVNGNESLPPFVRSWVSRVAHHARTADSAIVAQFHGILRMEQELAPAYSDLKRIAREASMGFFSETVESADSNLDDYIKEIHERATMRTSVLEAILQQHF
ncbi:MAG: hypothetical protein ABSG80_08505 [Verrucomicrobiota bacterium]|jgi:hypothetical protein